jgi:hypothetical protein
MNRDRKFLHTPDRLMVCHRCHENPATIEMTLPDAVTGQEFRHHLCGGCFDEVMRPYPEVSKELKDAHIERRPARIKSLPSELIPETLQKLIHKRHEVKSEIFSPPHI